MSWFEAVLDIAERIEEEAAGVRGMGDPFLRLSDRLISFARELRTVVKASEGQFTFFNPGPPPLGALGHSAWMGYQKNKEDGLEIKVKEQAQKEEATGEIMTELAGGPLAGDSVLRPAGMPFGAKTNITGSIYELKEDFLLHYVPK